MPAVATAVRKWFRPSSAGRYWWFARLTSDRFHPVGRGKWLAGRSAKISKKKKITTNIHHPLGNGRDDRHLAWGFYLPSITFPYIHRQPFLFFIFHISPWKSPR
jgi:hypothetical protein